jgi:hypothetical protein
VRAHQRHAVLRDRLPDVRGLLRAEAERLLTEDVLAGLGGRDDRVPVQVVRQADVDGVDVLLLEQFAIVRVRRRAQLLPAGACRLLDGVGNCGDAMSPTLIIQTLLSCRR